MDDLCVSIIINNYNYGRFLRAAIDSALGQSYPGTEVIVVDDGSTDDSRSVLAAYGEHVVPVLQENRGQAAAFNAGFARSRGDVVIFLDADDMLLPDTAAQVAAVFQADRAVARVQYRMAIVDADGALTGALLPPPGRRLAEGDLRRQMLAFPDDVLWQPTSGNAFAARALRSILPMPEPPYRLCADYYLSNLTPLCGSVVALDRPGALYRVHGQNNEYAAAPRLDRLRQTIVRTAQTHVELKRFADSLGLAGLPDDPHRVRSVTFLANRLVSLKLDPARHPIRRDRAWQLCLRGVQAALGRFDLPPQRRLAYAGWFVALLGAPRTLARWLAQLFFAPEQRPALKLPWRRHAPTPARSATRPVTWQTTGPNHDVRQERGRI